MRFAFATAFAGLLAFAASAHELDYQCFHRQAFPFGEYSGEETINYGRGRPIDVVHTKLDVALDFETETVSGTATHTFRPVGADAAEVAFDAVNLDISAVTDGFGTPVDFEVTPDKLRVYFKEPVAAGTAATLAIEYSVTRPLRGMHFRTPRLGYTAEETQAWTQGEAEDNRYWFPCIDYPNERASTEVVCTVRDDFVALSNGNLMGTVHDTASGKKTYHWRMRQDHVSYLVSLVAGPYVSVQDRAKGLPLFYYCLPGEEDDARATYRNTPSMFEVFHKVIGVPYPYDRYSQVSVIDFIAGGMENTTISTMTENIILDDSARLTRTMDGLISHELAHQWFGDLLTCRDWSHLWLNEGFATYLESVFYEHQFGRDHMIHDIIQNQRQVVRLDKGEGKSPVVSRNYSSPDAVFDYRPYAKGGSILHMLRNELGDELFWRAVKTYCTRYANQVVETNDLMRTAEEVSGIGLERFFDQWLYKTGYPELKVDYKWDNGEKLAKITIRQTQKVTEYTPLFAFSTEIALYTENGVHVEPVEISEAVHNVFVPLDGPPSFVRFDPDSAILKTLDFDKPKPMLLAQLKNDPSVAGKYQACEQLAKKTGDDVIEALANAIAHETFWGVRAEAAKALGEIDNDKAVEALLANIGIDESRVRLAVVEALGKSDRNAARDALVTRVKDDPASYIVSAAIGALGDQRVDRATDVITAALDRDSHAETIRNAAIRALAKIRAEESLETVAALTEADAPRQSRRTAIAAVGEIGELMSDKSAAREVLEARLSDPHPFRRTAAVNALVTLGDLQAIGALEKLAATTKDEKERERVRAAIRKLRTQNAAGDEVKSLREEVDGLTESREKLQERLDALEKRVDALNEEPESGDES